MPLRLSGSGGMTLPLTSTGAVFNDYEEGTFVPTLVTTTGTPTYQYQEGYYTKIGRQCFGGGIIGITNSSSLTGGIRITLPFPASSTASPTYGYTMGYSSDGSGFTWPISGAYGPPTWQSTGAGSGVMQWVVVGPTATAVSYNTANVGASWYTRFSFSYPCA
jgi:hypothetical protein